MSNVRGKCSKVNYHLLITISDKHMFFAVSVVLYPLSIADTLSPRSFTLSAKDQVFDIGRASKRDSKNRIPAPDNGWCDSRVMSRDHARFSVCLDKRVGSLMHYPRWLG